MRILPVLFLIASFALPTTTHAQLLPLLAPGQTASAVMGLQQLLNDAGEEVTERGEETEYFGPRTQSAIERIQCAYGIVCEGTPGSTGFGSVGPRTRALLESLLARGIVLGEATNGLVAWYRFDEGSGTAVKDSVSGINGTLAGGTWVSGKFGGALSFTESRDRVVIPENSALATSPRTVAFWAKPNSIKYYNMAYEDTQYNYGAINAYGQLRVNWMTADGDDEAANMKAEAEADEWQHFTVVYEPSFISVYRNGSLVSTTTVEGTIAPHPITAIGGRTQARGSFDGAIDDFKVYNRALAASEVDAVYRSTSVADATTPVPTSPVADTLRPFLTKIAVVKSSIGTSSALVRWMTDEPATTAVEYGVTTSYGTRVDGPSALALAHELLLTGLTPSTKYYLRVVSADAAGNVANSLARSFTTLAGTVTGTIPLPSLPTLPGLPLPIPAGQSTYYVDFASGADTNPGTSVAPWKHAPGDPAATGNPANVVLKGGDTVQFKGGVVYRGQISMKYAGAPGNPITYKGTGWGSGKAVIDGSEPLTGLRKCASQSECAGNPNWRSIYRTTVTVPAFIVEDPELNLNIMSGDEVLTVAQHPASTNRFYQAYENFYSVPPSSVTATTITDDRLATLGGASLVGSYVRVWGVPNEVHTRKITGYNASTRTITVESFMNDKTKNAYYAIANHPGGEIFDEPGEYYVNARTGELLVWPYSDRDVSNGNITMSVRPYGISLAGHGNLTIDGFLVRKQTGDGGREGHGIVKFILTPASGITVSNNEVAYSQSPQKGGAINLSGAVDSTIRDNYVHDIGGNMRGINASGRNVLIQDNHVRNVARTGIYFGEMTNGTIDRNLVEYNNSAHGNGMSVYQNSNNITISNNHVHHSNIAFTMQASSNLTIVNNVFDGSGESNYVVADWNNMGGTNRIVNNTIVGSDKQTSFLLSSADDVTPAVLFIVQNNIFDGAGNKDVLPGKIVLANNLYVGLGHFQSSRYGWSLSTGEKVADADDVFVDAGEGNYALRSGSPAIDAGLNLGALVSRDILGKRRPSGSGMDIGAYEYSR